MFFVKKVISFSLYGTDQLYYVGALENLARQKQIFPDWVCRFFVDTHIPPDLVVQLSQGGAEVGQGACRLPFEKFHNLKSVWRFLPAADPDVDAVLVRDTDSRVGWREKGAVDEWLASGKGAHIMRDHPSHHHKMMAGMWGVRGGVLSNLLELMREHQFNDKFGTDQRFLEEKVYPIIVADCLVHSSSIAFEGEDVRPFPPHAPDSMTPFVGAPISAENKLLVETIEQRKERLVRSGSYLSRTNSG